jgi:hypothetical protein
MKKRRKKKSAIENLVLGRLEGISGEVFADYSRQITELAGKKPGIYALYRKKSLYYVGLATNLRNRIKHHLHDKHAGKWDTFSLFVVRRDAHMKDLEAMTIRIAKPKGNDIRGSKIPSLKRSLKARIDAWHKEKTRSLLGIRDVVEQPPKKKPRKSRGVAGRQPSLAPFVSERFHIRHRHKGKLYIAHVRRDGTITFARESADWKRLMDKVHNSPSLAARAVTGRAMNGWTWWRYRNKMGEWVKLDRLRKR